MPSKNEFRLPPKILNKLYGTFKLLHAVFQKGCHEFNHENQRRMKWASMSMQNLCPSFCQTLAHYHIGMASLTTSILLFSFTFRPFFTSQYFTCREDRVRARCNAAQDKNWNCCLRTKWHWFN